VKILSRFLWNADQRFKIRLAHLEGGKARNAIPREATAIIVISPRILELIQVYFDSFTGIIKRELEPVEPDLEMTMVQVEMPENTVRRKQQKRLFNTLYACPNGVVAMSQAIPGMVETSTNLASVKLSGEDTLEIVTSQRSSVESAKRDIADRISSQFTLLGARVRHSDGYPGWKPNLESEILGISRDVYRELFSEDAEVKAIHAGLECGLLLQKYPDLDMISFGPTIKGVHTPEERLEIESVDRFWRFLLRMLEKAPVAR
jgi:dipeptidase D